MFRKHSQLNSVVTDYGNPTGTAIHGSGVAKGWPQGGLGKVSASRVGQKIFKNADARDEADADPNGTAF